jgi:hypothetical protein
MLCAVKSEFNVQVHAEVRQRRTYVMYNVVCNDLFH